MHKKSVKIHKLEVTINQIALLQKICQNPQRLSKTINQITLLQKSVNIHKVEVAINQIALLQKSEKSTKLKCNNQSNLSKSTKLKCNNQSNCFVTKIWSSRASTILLCLTSSALSDER